MSDHATNNDLKPFVDLWNEWLKSDVKRFEVWVTRPDIASKLSHALEDAFDKRPRPEEIYDYSSTGTCPVCGSEIVEEIVFTNSDESLAGKVQTCLSCLWQSVPLYE